jgi:hypothetical protein
MFVIRMDGHGLEADFPSTSMPRRVTYNLSEDKADLQRVQSSFR